MLKKLIFGSLITSLLSVTPVVAATIGETTALIPEAGLAKGTIADGESGNTNFQFGDFKAIGTIGEVDANTGMPLTGYPDGNAEGNP